MASATTSTSPSSALNAATARSTTKCVPTFAKRAVSLRAPTRGVQKKYISSSSSSSSSIPVTGELILWDAAKTSAAMMFVKDGDGKYSACNDALLKRLGFDKTDIIGKNDDEVCQNIQHIADTDEEHKRFHAKHSYRGEAITDLPKRWRANDSLVRNGHVGEGKIFKERYASLVDDKFHEVLVYKTKMTEDGTISGVAIPYMS